MTPSDIAAFDKLEQWKQKGAHRSYRIYSGSVFLVRLASKSWECADGETLAIAVNRALKEKPAKKCADCGKRHKRTVECAVHGGHV